MSVLSAGRPAFAYNHGVISKAPAPTLTVWQDVQLYGRMARPLQLLAVFLVAAWRFLIALNRQPLFDPATFLYALLPLLLVSASIHYANGYADVEADALTQRTPFSGGSGALGDFNVSPHLALQSARVNLIAGLALALAFTLAGRLAPLALLLLALGAFGGWMYSLPTILELKE